MPNSPSTLKSTSNDTERPHRLLITVGFACVAVFIASEPLLFDGVPPSMQLIQGSPLFLLWLLVMFGGAGVRS